MPRQKHLASAGTVGWEPQTTDFSIDKTSEFPLASVGFVFQFCMRKQLSSDVLRDRERIEFC